MYGTCILVSGQWDLRWPSLPTSVTVVTGLDCGGWGRFVEYETEGRADSFIVGLFGQLSDRNGHSSSQGYGQLACGGEYISMSLAVNVVYTCGLMPWRRCAHDVMQFASVFRLQKETTFLGVAIMDQFLSDRSRRPFPPDSLQLLGTACMLVAAKFEEAPPPRWGRMDGFHFSEVKLQKSVLSLIWQYAVFLFVCLFVFFFAAWSVIAVRLARGLLVKARFWLWRQKF